MFSSDVPSLQATFDLFKGGWSLKLPDATGLRAGLVEHLNDPRINWSSNEIGGFFGKRVLELGPFEAYNTLDMERLGAEVTAIEGSKDNFVKCLIMKNAFNMRATFLHGDFNRYDIPLRSGYDVVWASGILYHMTDPINLLRKLTSLSDQIFIWTQYYDAEVLSNDHPTIGHFDPAQNLEVAFEGREIKLHWRSYIQKNANGLFSGGEQSFAYWMELPDILFVLEKLSFGRITMGVNNPSYENGPACFFIARRS